MKQKSKTQEYVESLLVAALIAFFVRSFMVQAFKIPSSSMEPTLLVGDHLLVNRLSYVMKVPFTDIVILNLGNPSRSDVVVFRYPVDRSKDFIKRVIGIEGDVVEIRDKAIYLNGQKMDDPHAHFAEDSIVPGVFPSVTTSDLSRSPRVLISLWVTTGTGASTAGSGDS